MKVLTAMMCLLYIFGCETGGKKRENAEISSKKTSASKNEEKEQAAPKEPEASNNFVTLINSFSNSPLTSHTVSLNKADEIAEKFMEAKSRAGLESKIAAERLSKKSLGQVLSTAKKLAATEMEKAAGNTIPDTAKLELALAAINNKNYAFGEYFLQILTDSKNPKIKAAAYNAIGAIALKDDRVPEAVLYFKQALSASSSYRPALLNLGFVALKGGDFETARKLLSDMQNDWFVQYGLITLARLDGNESIADDLCEKVLKKAPQHKAALHNCALLELQNKRNFNKARALAEKASTATYGDSEWDEKAMRLINDVDYEEAMSKREKVQKKSAEKQTKEPGPKASGTSNPPGGDAPPPGDSGGATPQ